jgi:hypothetical protein
MKPDLDNIIECALVGLIVIGIACVAAAFVTATIKLCLLMFE